MPLKIGLIGRREGGEVVGSNTPVDISNKLTFADKKEKHGTDAKGYASKVKCNYCPKLLPEEILGSSGILELEKIQNLEQKKTKPKKTL